jgi:hypothetical protein
MRPARSTAAAVAAAAALSVAFPVRAEERTAPDLRPDEWRAAGITVGALVMDGVLAAKWKPTHCNICSSNTLDEKARDALVWSHPKDAQLASDLLANVAIPLLAGADAIRSTTTWGNAGRDVLVVAESASLSTLATEVAKNGFARLRPGLPATAVQGAAAYQSLWSGHTQFAFSVAVSQAMQDSMRGDEAAPWVWAVGLTLAGAVGYLRVAGDEHWLTDVLAGAAVGSAFGVGVPLAEKRLVHGVTLSPAPGGIALHF